MKEALIHDYPGTSASCSLGCFRPKSRFRPVRLRVSATSPDQAMTARVGNWVKAQTSRSERSTVFLYSRKAERSRPRPRPTARPPDAKTLFLGKMGPSGRVG